MKELVRVTSIESGGIWVEGVQSSACSSCQAKSGCGQQSLKQLGRPVSLWIPAVEHSVQVGDQVMVELPEGAVARSALALYGVPLIGLTLGAALGQWAAWPEWQMLLSAGVGLAIGFAVARGLSECYQHQWQPRLVRANTACSAVDLVL